MGQYIEEEDDLNGTEPDCAKRHILLPFADESLWSKHSRAVLYFLLMCYLFLGLYVAVNHFMIAVLKIISHKRKVTVRDEFGRVLSEKYVNVWNPTLANLTLLAFGSSAPEIFLSSIEIFSHGFHTGRLAAHAIVGSAAFNGLLVTAVANFFVPRMEKRRISNMVSHLVTCFFAVFAYVWLSIVLEANTPDVVDLWEAILTLLFYPILLVVGYLADRKFFCHRWPKQNSVNSVDKLYVSNGVDIDDISKPNYITADDDKTPVSNSNDDRVMTSDHKGVHVFHIDDKGNIHSRAKSALFEGISSISASDAVDDRSRLIELQKYLKAKHPGISAKKLAQLTALEIESSKSHDQIYYRIEGDKKKLLENKAAKQEEKYKTQHDVEDEEHGEEQQHHRHHRSFREHNLAFVRLAACEYHIDLAQPKLTVKIVRSGYSKSLVSLRYELFTAMPHRGPTQQFGIVRFYPETLESDLHFELPINNSNSALLEDMMEKQLIFYIRIEKKNPGATNLRIAEPSIAKIYLLRSIDPKERCTVQMDETNLICSEAAGFVDVPVSVDGFVHAERFFVDWETVNETAIEGDDFIGKSGHLSFQRNEQTKMISIPIINDFVAEKHETFLIRLRKKLTPDGNDVFAIGKPSETRITILGDKKVDEHVLKSDKMVQSFMQSMEPGALSWIDQFKRAANVNEGMFGSATMLDYVLHVLLFGWKIVCAFIPPPSILGGWLTFFVSLAVIGLLTTLMSDAAIIFGCLVGIREEVTGLLFVVIGTGWPDMFASRLAAIYEPTADSAIGHVVCDSSVNVFIGLGLPWTFAAAYWASHGKRFVVRTRGLVFSVSIYIVFSFIVMAVMFIRRFSKAFGKAELGGPQKTKVATSLFLIALYIVFVVLCILVIEDIIHVPVIGNTQPESH